MKIGEAESWLSNGLDSVYGRDESTGIASMVMEELTGMDRGLRSMNRGRALEAEQLETLAVMAKRLQASEPVQYVLGSCWFAGLRLFVNPSVLIPRPETEELVDWIVRDLEAKGLPVFDKGPTDADETTRLKILDVGTGSGCIALALKNRMPRAEVWGCDVSEEALNIARRNGSELDIRVDFQGIDFLDEVRQKLLPTVDVLVSNPPYIPRRDAAQMHANVLDHEPHLALFVPDEDALLFYRALARFGHKRLYSGGLLYVEIHEDLAAGVDELLRNEGYTNITIRRDMQGKERMVRAEKGDASGASGTVIL
jgi:release factor glutamine methyltransferase